MAAVQELYREIPIITRAWATLAGLTTLACQFGLVSPFALYFNPGLILQGEVWRLVTSFLYFGLFDLEFIFHMYFLVHYSKTLEESEFAGRTSGMFWMLILGAASMLCMGPFVGLPFLGSSLSFMVVYVWARKARNQPLNFFGILDFNAPYLPWVLLGFAGVMGQSLWPDLLGIVVGHLFYFFDDVYPQTSGLHLVATPRFVARLFGELDQ
eukprot:a339990_138.p1 GENE.a339990_138~~a339990_138.p1  ORF type:complete len:222 (+),score=64.16 a339990_138:35-667(+)